jgi:hypothetical protein
MGQVPDNEGYRQIIVWLEQGFTSDILVLVPSLKTSAPSRVLQALLSDHIQLPAYEDDTEGGLDRNLYLNKVRFCTFHACKEAACVLSSASTNNVVAPGATKTSPRCLSAAHENAQRHQLSVTVGDIP